MPPQQPPQQGTDPVDPANSFIQAMLVLALLACLGTITLSVIELNQHYGVTFGGMLEPPKAQQQQPAEDTQEKQPSPDQKNQSSPSESSDSSSSSSSSSSESEGASSSDSSQ